MESSLLGEKIRNSVPALVLAAGEGSRLKDCTELKPLLQVAGMPLIGRVLRGLKEAGVQKVWIAVGYKGDMAREKIGDNYAGLKIRYIQVDNWEKGNLYSLLAAEEVFKQIFCFA